jgi:hypothetical protein
MIFFCLFLCNISGFDDLVPLKGCTVMGHKGEEVSGSGRMMYLFGEVAGFFPAGGKTTEVDSGQEDPVNQEQDSLTQHPVDSEFC